jgi:hypothetical protein
MNSTTESKQETPQTKKKPACDTRKKPGRPPKHPVEKDYKQMLHDSELSTALELFEERDFLDPRSLSADQAMFCHLYATVGMDRVSAFKKSHESKCIDKSEAWIKRSAKALTEKISVKNHIERLQREDVLRELQSSPELGIALSGRLCQELVSINAVKVLLDKNSDSKLKLLAGAQIGSLKHVDAFLRSSSSNTLTNNFITGAFQVDQSMDSSSAKAKLIASLTKTLKDRSESVTCGLLASGPIINVENLLEEPEPIDSM